MTTPNNTVSAVFIDRLGFDGTSMTVDGVTWPDGPVPVLFNNKQVGTATARQDGDKTVATMTIDDDGVRQLVKEGKGPLVSMGYSKPEDK